MARYIGNELELFAHATNWKRYYGARIKPRLGARVLEVGAGLGEVTRQLCDGTQQAWVCLESDEKFCDTIRDRLAARELPACCSVIHGTTETIDTGLRFDTVLYVDVLEHIEDDRAELTRVAQLLADGGVLIVLAPAGRALFSEFDRRIGHYRRYNKERMRQIIPQGFAFERLEYLDCTGTSTLLANRILLRQSTPQLWQVSLWDRLMIPLSRCLDPLIGHAFGKSILAVMSKHA